MDESLLQWLLQSPEPWTRYRTLTALMHLPSTDGRVQAARAEVLAHPQVQALAQEVCAWPGGAIRRHNDTSHPLHKLGVLADFGLQAADPALAPAVEAVLAHQSAQGAFQSVTNIAPAFGGSGEDAWTWMACDAPVLLSALLSLGLANDPRLERALAHLASLAEENGWRCACAPELGKFRGPGRKADPCPIANVYALKALAHSPQWASSPAAERGVEMLLQHWQRQAEQKFYLFGIGTDFRKLKYPFVWYDILHTADVLSRFPWACRDPRLHQMVSSITALAQPDGRCCAGSAYLAWKGWSFANKKSPSPWLTLLVLQLTERLK